MRTNRKIYEESVDLFQRENNFVCLTSSRPSHYAQNLSRDGMNMIVSGAKASRFSYAAMTLTVDPPLPGDLAFYISSDPSDEQPCKYIFCLDELPTFCRLYSKNLGKYSKGQPLRNTKIHIDIPKTWKQQSREIDRSGFSLLRLHKLLDPLRQLHSFGAAQIQGPLSASYKSRVIADLCKECPTAMDVIGTATVILAQGDEQVSQGLPIDAINKYKTALNHVRSCCWLYDEQVLIMDGGPFPGLTAKQTMRNLKVRLLARIASTYFQNGMLRMARIYVERALDPHHNFDYEYHKLHQLYRRPWQHVVYAEVLYVSAQIWYAYGHVSDAIWDLRKAQEYVELNEEQQFTLEAWQRHEDRLSERRAKKDQARETRFQKEGLKTEGTRTRSTLVGFRVYANHSQKEFSLFATGKRRATGF